MERISGGKKRALFVLFLAYYLIRDLEESGVEDSVLISDIPRSAVAEGDSAPCGAGGLKWNTTMEKAHGIITGYGKGCAVARK